jgi:flagellar M-ring protein FliF
MEGARYQRALEGEIARSISAIGNVQSARVHLAMAKQSAFVRDRRPPSASVVVMLHRGRALDRGQVAAITHLVSSSVAEMSADNVTIIDQNGALLTDRDKDEGAGLSNRQLEYTRSIEEHYIRRIEEILSPILGVGAVRAQVSVETDSAATEETEETYGNPEKPLVRSEQTLEERSQGSLPLGIPGALSNQPPPPPQIGEDGKAEDAPRDPRNREPYSTRDEATRNFELDKRIRHVRQLPGKVRRVTAAVVVDHRQVLGEDGELTREPLSAEELERISSLVREAVGYDEARGDRVNVVNSAFADSLNGGMASPEQWWETRWFLTLARLGIIGLVVLVALLVVVRPALRTLLQRHTLHLQEVEDAAKLPALDSESDSNQEQVHTLTQNEEDALPNDVVRLSQKQHELDTNYPTDIGAHVKTVKDLVADDPLRAVQVIKHWVSSDA